MFTNPSGPQNKEVKNVIVKKTIQTPWLTPARACAKILKDFIYHDKDALDLAKHIRNDAKGVFVYKFV